MSSITTHDTPRGFSFSEYMTCLTGIVWRDFKPGGGKPGVVDRIPVLPRQRSGPADRMVVPPHGLPDLVSRRARYPHKRGARGAPPRGKPG